MVFWGQMCNNLMLFLKKEKHDNARQQMYNLANYFLGCSLWYMIPTINGISKMKLSNESSQFMLIYWGKVLKLTLNKCIILHIR